ncbi:MAG: COX15/CtaA family protein [Planctomycetota bacterium]|nr:COX15/CtaA family protein [Planctomycetota bacterium]
MNSRPAPPDSRWPHRLAVLLACTTFPLIWVGGLVTTYDAGMAVPDWPGTYGYNLFLYPWQTWLAGPWDLFIEHGHRLLGALAGLLTIAVVWASYRGDQRRWLRYLAVVALVAVIAQGCLGGARVLLNARLLAMLHGCLGPAFFGLCVALCGFTSPWWRTLPRDLTGSSTVWFDRLALSNLLATYVQLVLGAVLRHIPVGASLTVFRATVYLHLALATVVTAHIVWLTWQVGRRRVTSPALRWPVIGLDLLLVCQLILGCATWVVNYWWPTWALDLGMAVQYTTIEAKGWLQSSTATAHQATGSLLLGLAVLVLLRSRRVLRAAVVADADRSVSGRGVIA